MDFRVVKAVETVILSAFLVGAGVVALDAGADPTLIGSIVCVGILTIAGKTFHEVKEVASVLSSGRIVISAEHDDEDE